MTGHVPPPPTTGTVGLVGRFHSLLDFGRYIVAVIELDDHGLTAVIHFDNVNHRRAARRWQPGDQLVIHGTTTSTVRPGATSIALLVSAHEVHKVRPDNIRAIGPQLHDHKRHTPPHTRRRLERQQRHQEDTSP